MQSWDELVAAIDPEHQAVLNHPMRSMLNTEQAVRSFMEHHVWAVWDFMSLVTRLQRDLTCTTVPWMPRKVGRPGSKALARFINEVKLAEESDMDGHGGYCSHLDLYVRAMSEVGASAMPMVGFIQWCGERPGDDPVQVAAQAGAPSAAQYFIGHTLDVVAFAPTHEVAAVFALSRETIIPDMFRGLRGSLAQHPAVRYYLDRHIDLDGNEHGPAARRLVEGLCGDDPIKWGQARSSAAGALTMRRHLWDGVAMHIINGRTQP